MFIHIISVFLLWSSSLLNQIVMCYISQNGLNFQMKAREAWNPRLPILPGAGHFRGRPPRAAWAQPPRPRRGHRRPLRTTLITSVNRWSSLLRSRRESRVLRLSSGLQILSIGQCLWTREKPFLSPKASKTEVRPAFEAILFAEKGVGTKVFFPFFAGKLALFHAGLF